MVKTVKKQRRFSIDSSDQVVPQGIAALTNPEPVAIAADTGVVNSPAAFDPSADGYQRLPVELIERDVNQPRHSQSQAFSQASLQELADSIATSGIIQPVIVRRDGDRYRLIAGERRWRAAQIAGLYEIPALIRSVDPRQIRLIALIENLQREDLNAIEEAEAIEALAQEGDLSNAEIGKTLGKAKSTIGLLRGLLKLDDQVQEAVRKNYLAASLARCLISLPATEQRRLTHRAIRENWSARRMETEVARFARQGKTSTSILASAARPGSRTDPDIAMLQENLSTLYRSPIRIRPSGKGRGRIEIQYTSLDDLSRILDQMGYREPEMD